MNYYNEISKGYDELHGEEQMRKARIIAGRLDPAKNDCLLDVGSGNGAYLALFDCQVTGIDPSEELVNKYGGEHKLIVGKAENMPFQDNTFDIVMSITSIHNFDSIEKGLKEMRRVGRDGFVFSVLKKSKNAARIEKLINKFFVVDEIVEERIDRIFFCHEHI